MKHLLQLTSQNMTTAIVPSAAVVAAEVAAATVVTSKSKQRQQQQARQQLFFLVMVLWYFGEGQLRLRQRQQRGASAKRYYACAVSGVVAGAESLGGTQNCRVECVHRGREASRRR